MKLSEKTSGFVAAIARKFKFILIGIAIYFAVLVVYDFCVFKRGTQEMLVTYLPLLIIGAFVWFGVRLIYYTQIKNKNCS